jgi:hypothetical protein
MDGSCGEGSTKEVSIINTITLERDSGHPMSISLSAIRKVGCRRWKDAGLIIYQVVRGVRWRSLD